MKKTYEKPALEIITLRLIDVLGQSEQVIPNVDVTVSGTEGSIGGSGDDDLLD